MRAFPLKPLLLVAAAPRVCISAQVSAQQEALSCQGGRRIRSVRTRTQCLLIKGIVASN